MFYTYSYFDQLVLLYIAMFLTASAIGREYRRGLDLFRLFLVTLHMLIVYSLYIMGYVSRTVSERNAQALNQMALLHRLVHAFLEQLRRHKVHQLF